MDYTKELAFLKNLNLPLVYDGSIQDSKGNTILMVNRKSGTTPLCPSERDELLKYVCEILNKSLIKPKGNQERIPKLFYF